MIYCPVCTRPISYWSTVARGRPTRPIWCDHCQVGLQRKTSVATWGWLVVILIVNAAGLVLGLGAATLPLFLLDFYVDAATLRLSPLRLEQGLRQ